MEVSDAVVTRPFRLQTIGNRMGKGCCRTCAPFRFLQEVMQNCYRQQEKRRVATHWIEQCQRKYMIHYTAVLPKIPHSNCDKRVPNRPLRGRRGRLGTLLQLLECGTFGRTAVLGSVSLDLRSTLDLKHCRCGSSHAAWWSRLQPFSENSRTATVPKVFRIGLCGVVKADLELFCNCWSAGILVERLYSLLCLRAPLSWFPGRLRLPSTVRFCSIHCV